MCVCVCVCVVGGCEGGVVVCVCVCVFFSFPPLFIQNAHTERYLSK